MLPKILRRLFGKTFWRRISFDQLSELYISSMLRNLALSLVGIFVPIYLYETGYSIAEILLYLAAVSLTRAIIDAPVGMVVGKIGPKHTMLCSYVVQIISLVLLATLPGMQWPLPLIAFVWGLSTSLFFVAYHTDFSAIEHVEKEGKELSYLNGLERIGGVLGPLAGGLVATFFGAQYTIIAAIAFFAVATVPLFITKEPIPRQKRINYKGFPLHEIKRHWLAYGSFGVESILTLILWPLFIAVFIFGQNAYAPIGIVTSVSLAISLVATYAMGKIVDEKRGGQLLRLGLYGNILIHLTRPFAGGFQGVLAINIINDGINPAYRVPFLKGFYDVINLYPAYRIAQVVVLEIVSAIFRGSVWLLLWLLVITTDAKTAMIIGFGVAAAASIGILFHRFQALR